MPTVYHSGGFALCSTCGAQAAPGDDITPHESTAEDIGSTCDTCRACLVAPGEWMTHDEATGPGVLWLRCRGLAPVEPHHA